MGHLRREEDVRQDRAGRDPLDVLVDEKGKIAVAQYNVKATGHVAKLRGEALNEPRALIAGICVPAGRRDGTDSLRRSTAAVEAVAIRCCRLGVSGWPTRRV